MSRLLSARQIRQLRHHLKRGGILAYPTESCYGLGCLPQHSVALRRLIRLKKRPQHKGMIVIGDSLMRLQTLLQPLAAATQQQLMTIWPAPKTFLLPAHAQLPVLLRGRGRNQLAVRVPAHEGARTLCAVLQTPLVSTSCNRAGRRPCRHAREVRRQFGRAIQIVAGRVGSAKTPSQLIDWATGKRLR